jgi:hypothetical protein
MSSHSLEEGSRKEIGVGYGERCRRRWVSIDVLIDVVMDSVCIRDVVCRKKEKEKKKALM